MAIDVELANRQANQILSYASQLQQVHRHISSYKSSIVAGWQAQEVSYITQGIDQTIAQINQIIREMEALSGDIKSTAMAIRREEEAAEAAEAAARAREEELKKSVAGAGL